VHLICKNQYFMRLSVTRNASCPRSPARDWLIGESAARAEVEKVWHAAGVGGVH